MKKLKQQQQKKKELKIELQNKMLALLKITLISLYNDSI